MRSIQTSEIWKQLRISDVGGGDRRLSQFVIHDLDPCLRYILRGRYTRIHKRGEIFISYQFRPIYLISIDQFCSSFMYLKIFIFRLKRLKIDPIFQNIMKGLKPNIKSHPKLPKGEKSAVIPMSESSAGLITKNNSFLSQT